MADVPFQDAYWVVPALLLAGEYPGASLPSKTAARVARLLDAGITVCLDLTLPRESAGYSETLQNTAAERGVAVEYHHLPIQDFSVPSRAAMSAILDRIDAANAAGRGVYVHCRAGIGRTGTVVGCYLVRHGRSGALALAEIQSLRQNTLSWWYSSPESPAQREFILNWTDGE